MRQTSCDEMREPVRKGDVWRPETCLLVCGMKRDRTVSKNFLMIHTVQEVQGRCGGKDNLQSYFSSAVSHTQSLLEFVTSHVTESRNQNNNLCFRTMVIKTLLLKCYLLIRLACDV